MARLAGSMSGNERHNGVQAQPIATAQVTVISNPAAITDTNPNGIQVSSNIPPGKADLMLIKLMSEGINFMVESIKARPAVSASVVMPDGSPAPLPPKGFSQEENTGMAESK